MAEEIGIEAAVGERFEGRDLLIGVLDRRRREAERSEAAGVTDRSSELRRGGAGHWRLDDRAI
jgi:hypothetical protein